MLSDQNSPIDEVIDFVRAYRGLGTRFNLAFAARCRAEAGVDEGDPSARELLHKLVNMIAELSRFEAKEAISLIDVGLTAVSALGPMIGPTLESQAVIQELEKEGALRQRMLAWQLGLALRTRKERLEYALAALRHKEEAVRRGAIAALERGWPGSPEVEEALLEVIRKDNLQRVRQAAIKALQRSWPKNPQILDAVESRLDKKGTYTDVVWLIEYVGANWRGDTRALELILRLSGLRLPSVFDYYTVIKSAADTVTQGWRDHRDAFKVLGDAVLGSHTLWAKATAVVAITRGWPRGAESYAVLRELAVDGEHSEERRLALLAVAGYFSSPYQENWPLDVLYHHSPNAHLRVYFRFAPRSLRETPFGAAETHGLLTDRLKNDSDMEIRELAQEILEHFKRHA
jgi:hypothetical protein